MKKRKFPRIWQGGSCVILGGGPSLKEVDFDLIKGLRIVGVNNAYGDPITDGKGKAYHYKPRDWVDICWFGDARWYQWHKKWLRFYMGMLMTSKEQLHGRDGIFSMERSRKKKFGIENRPGNIAWNGNSGGSAINLAYHLGVKSIILLGFDMQRVDGKANWHNDHPTPSKTPYSRFLGSFPAIAKDADRLGLTILNATPGTAIPDFDICTLEEAVKRCEDIKERNHQN